MLMALHEPLHKEPSTLAHSAFAPLVGITQLAGMRATSTTTNTAAAATATQPPRFTSARAQYDRGVHQSRGAGAINGGGIHQHAVLLRQTRQPRHQGIERRLLQAHREAAAEARLAARERTPQPRLARRAINDDQERLT